MRKNPDASGLNQSVVVVWSDWMIITSLYHVSVQHFDANPTLEVMSRLSRCLRWSGVETVYDGLKTDWE